MFSIIPSIRELWAELDVNDRTIMVFGPLLVLSIGVVSSWLTVVWA